MGAGVGCSGVPPSSCCPGGVTLKAKLFLLAQPKGFCYKNVFSEFYCSLLVPAVPLYRYGVRENDHEYVQRRVDFNSPLFKPEIGFPFGKTLRDSLYVSPCCPECTSFQSLM